MSPTYKITRTKLATLAYKYVQLRTVYYLLSSFFWKPFASWNVWPYIPHVRKVAEIRRKHCHYCYFVLIYRKIWATASKWPGSLMKLRSELEAEFFFSWADWLPQRLSFAAEHNTEHMEGSLVIDHSVKASVTNLRPNEVINCHYEKLQFLKLKWVLFLKFRTRPFFGSSWYH